MSATSPTSSDSLADVSAPPAAARPRGGLFWLCVAGLSLAALLGHHRGFEGAFYLDDWINIHRNPAVGSFENLGSHFFRVMRPGLQLSLAFNVWLGGHDVWGFHVFNFAVHVAAGLTLFALTRRTLRLPCFAGRFEHSADGLAFAAALLWLVHPAQTQAVTYIVQRCESLMALFYLLCLYCVSRAATAPRGWPWRVGAAAAFAVAMACKEVAITAIPAAMLYDAVFLSRGAWEPLRRRWPMYAALGAAALAACWHTHVVVSGMPGATGGFGYTGVTPWEYARSQPGVILHYLRIIFWPEGLCLDRAWPVARTASEIVPPAILVGLLLGTSLALLRWRPAAGFLGAAFFLILAPTSSFMPIADLAFDHRVYLPLAAVVLLVVVGVHLACARWMRDRRAAAVLQGGLLALACGLLIPRTLERNREYCDPIAFWRGNTRAAPRNDRAWTHLGWELQKARRHDEARAALRRSLALNPQSHHALLLLGRCDADQGDDAAAIAWFERSVRASPDFAEAHHALGLARARRGEHALALASADRAVALEPRSGTIRSARAEALARLNRGAEAVAEARAALRLEPRSAAVKLRLAWMLSTVGATSARNGAEAVALAEEVAHAPRPHPTALDVLAAAYAEQGRYEEAAAAARRALAQAAAAGAKQLAGEIEARLKLYEAKRPYRLAADGGAPPRDPATAVKSS